MKPGKMVIEELSAFDFEKTVSTLITEAERSGWQVPAVHDLQQSLAKSGKSVKPVTVIEICKPKFSGQLLEMNHERIMSVIMPCRISVYNKDDGKTYVSVIDGGKLAEGQPEKIAEVMKAASDETIEIVKIVTL